MPAPGPEQVGRTRAGRAARQPFAYAVIRVVPRVERGEFVNAGVVLLCRPRRYLGARVSLDVARLRALDPTSDVDEIRAHLDLVRRIAEGDREAGPIAKLSSAERFHWLVSPSSTVIQASDVHAGLTEDPAATLGHLFANLVEPPGGP